MAIKEDSFWTEKSYTIREVVTQKTLPIMVKVIEGIYSESDTETFDRGDLLSIDKVGSIQNVLACLSDGNAADKDEGDQDKILIPLQHKGKLNIISLYNGKTGFITVKQLCAHFPRFIKNLKMIKDESGTVVEPDEILELDRILPSRGLVLKSKAGDIILNERRRELISYLPDPTEYTLNDAVSRFPLPLHVKFLDNEFLQTILSDSQELLANVTLYEGKCLKLLKVIHQKIIIGHRISTEVVIHDTRNVKEQSCERLDVSLLWDSEVATEVEVSIPRDAEDSTYEDMSSMKFDSQRHVQNEESNDGIYLDMAQTLKANKMTKGQGNPERKPLPPLPVKPGQGNTNRKRPPPLPLRKESTQLTRMPSCGETEQGNKKQLPTPPPHTLISPLRPPDSLLAPGSSRFDIHPGPPCLLPWPSTPGSNILPTPVSNSSPTPGSNRSPTPGSNRSPTPGSNRSPTPGSNRSPTPGSNRSSTPGSNRSPTPGSNRSPTPGSNRSSTPGSNRSPTPGSNRSSTSGSNRSPTPGSNRSPTPGSNRSPTPGSNRSSTPGSNRSPTPGSNRSSTSGSNRSPTPGSNRSSTSGSNRSSTSGSNRSPTPESNRVSDGPSVDDKEISNILASTKESYISNIPQKVQSSIKKLHNDLFRFFSKKSSLKKQKSPDHQKPAEMDTDILKQCRSELDECPGVPVNTRLCATSTRTSFPNQYTLSPVPKSPMSPENDMREYDYVDFPVKRKIHLLEMKHDSCSDFQSLSSIDLCQLLYKCKMESLARKCDEENLDGSFFTNISDDVLKNQFLLNEIQLIKFRKIKEEGWIPK